MTRILILSLLLLTACSTPNPGVWQSLCVDAGKHDFKPSPLIVSTDTVIAYEWRFLPEMQYDLGSADQCDWNKLHGVAWHLYNNHEDALMIAWRWSLEGFWQVAAYYHDEGETGWSGAPCNALSSLDTDSAIPYAKVYPGETFRTELRLRYDGWAEADVASASGVVTYRHYFGIETDNRYREIGAWFGGNRTAPVKMCLERKRLN